LVSPRASISLSKIHNKSNGQRVIGGCAPYDKCNANGIKGKQTINNSEKSKRKESGGEVRRFPILLLSSLLLCRF